MTNNTRIFPIKTSLLRQTQGYTLIEIMLVLSIIAVLLGAAIYSMVPNFDTAKVQRVQADIVTITTELKLYELDNNFPPTTEQGLMALYKEPTTDPKPRRWQQHSSEILMDPWHMPYNYRCPGIHNPNGFDVYSFGPSKQENDKEIGNWDDSNK